MAATTSSLSPTSEANWTPKRAALATLVVTGVIGSVVLICWFNHIVILLLLAIVLATALKPLVSWLAARGVRWPFAVGAVFAILAVSLLALIVLAGPSIMRQSTDFLADLPEKYQRMQAKLAASDSEMLRRAVNLLPQALPGTDVPESTEHGESPSADEPVWQPAVELTQSALQAVVAALLVCVLSAYWLLQEQRTLQALLLAVPRERRDEVRELIATIDEKLGAYVRGQFFLCMVVGLLSYLGYRLIGLPQAGLLALVAGLLEAVPMIGPILAAVPALLVAVGSDPTKAVGVIVVTLVIQQVENYLLVPRVMDRAVGMRGLVTLLAIAAFGTMFGLLGAVLAIPLAVIVHVMVDRYVLGQEVLEPEQPAGRDRASRVRFELQSLVKDVRMVIRNKPHEAKEGNDALEEAIETLAADLDRSLANDEETAVELGSPMGAVA